MDERRIDTALTIGVVLLMLTGAVVLGMAWGRM
jgi:hypothetical protein